MTSGTISFQANDKMDVFHVAQVIESGIGPSDEALLNLEDSQFDSDKAWVTGNVPKIKLVNIEGDTAIINAWYKGESFDNPFLIRVYVECELAEELEEGETDDESGNENGTDDDALEPQEINL